MTHPPGREKGGVKEDLSEVLPVYIFQHLHLPDGYPVEPHEAFVLQGDFIFFHADFETVQSCLVSNCGEFAIIKIRII